MVEEVSKPIRKRTSKILKTILDSPYKKLFLVLAGSFIFSIFAFNAMIFFNDIKDVLNPDDDKQYQESIVEIKGFFIKENTFLKEKVKKEEYKVKYEVEKRAKEEIQVKYEALQMKMEE